MSTEWTLNLFGDKTGLVGSSGIDACVAKVDGVFSTPDWEPPEKKDQSVSESG